MNSLRLKFPGALCTGRAPKIPLLFSGTLTRSEGLNSLTREKEDQLPENQSKKTSYIQCIYIYTHQYIYAPYTLYIKKNRKTRESLRFQEVILVLMRGEF